MPPKIDTNRLPFKVRIFTSNNVPLWTGDKQNIVVIGSGIGGMASGALFAKMGHKVTVLEMNKKHIGGHGRWLTFHGIKFSMGPQYVWEFNEGEQGDRFMEFLGIKENNPFLLMAKNGFEKIIVGNRDFDSNSYFCNFKVPLGLENFRDELSELFPDEADEIKRLIDDMIEIFNNFKTYFSESVTNEGRIFVAAKFILRGEASFQIKMKMGRVLFQSLSDWFDSYGVSSMVRRILYGHGGIFAESESEMSAIAYIIGTGNYHKGARYPEKGFHHFFGSIQRGKKAVRLELEDDMVKKVVCEDGSEYQCDFVFSDISPRLTDALLDKEPEKFEYTPSHCIPTICIGFKKGLAAMKEIKGRNYWWQNGTEINYHRPDMTAPPQMLFINSPTANGFTESTEKDMDALVLFCPGNYDQEKEIHEQGNAAVTKFKKKLAGDVVDILEQNVFPGIKEKLVFAEVISSIDIENQIGTERGSAYGRRMSVREVLKGTIEEAEKPANLYNVSSTKNFPGIAEGISTAALLLEELTGKKV